MPTRITRSYSRRGLFGGRVRTTRSWTVGQPKRSQAYNGGPRVQVRLTGRDLLEMEQRQQEEEAEHATAIAELHQQAVDRHTARMAQLAVPALYLYRQPYALAALALFAIVTLAGFAWQPALCVSMALAGALAVVDWGNLSTLHGRIHWAAFFATRSTWAWVAAVCMVLFYYVPVAAYLVQNLQLVPSVADAQRARLRDDIARLEAAVHQNQDQDQAPTA